jgi:hypothetical protein
MNMPRNPFENLYYDDYYYEKMYELLKEDYQKLIEYYSSIQMVDKLGDVEQRSVVNVTDDYNWNISILKNGYWMCIYREGKSSAISILLQTGFHIRQVSHSTDVNTFCNNVAAKLHDPLNNYISNCSLFNLMNVNSAFYSDYYKTKLRLNIFLKCNKLVFDEIRNFDEKIADELMQIAFENIESLIK